VSLLCCGVFATSSHDQSKHGVFSEELEGLRKVKILFGGSSPSSTTDIDLYERVAFHFSESGLLLAPSSEDAK